MSQIATQVARNSRTHLYYKCDFDPLIKRAEQGEKSRLSFLQKICADNGLAIKFSDNTLVIFDETDLEKQSPVKTFDYDYSTILHFDATATLNEIYKSCEVSYKHGTKDELIRAKFDSGVPIGKVLKINQRVESQAEAEHLAKKKLREKNKEETKINLTTVGDFSLLAGNVVSLKNHGFFDGNYLIEKATHSIGNGYTTKLELRRCLNGY